MQKNLRVCNHSTRNVTIIQVLCNEEISYVKMNEMSAYIRNVVLMNKTCIIEGKICISRMIRSFHQI